MDDIGIMPCLLTSPTVGLNPTIPLTEAGQDIEPFVSVPIARSTEPDATATAEPELDPQGFLSNTYGFFVCPPTPLQPLDEKDAR